MGISENNQRADARANRAKIIECARGALAREPGVPLSSIAKMAGVGPGTLYRHFPNRETLVLAVYQHEIDTVAEYATKLVAKYPPVDAFRLWCGRLVNLGQMKQGLAGVLSTVMSERDIPYLRELYSPILGAMEYLLRTGEASGEFISGVDAEDVMQLLGFIWRIQRDAAGLARIERLVTLVVRSLVETN